MKRTLVIATRNKGKLLEFSELFSGMEITVCGLDDFGPIPHVIEDGETFEDNAVIKARFTARILGFPALADDSGIMVKSLGGMPGVHSARYAGESATDEENNLKLLHALKNRKDREAAFICVLAIAVPRGPALIYEGRCEGLVLDSQLGSNGFGYDPLFYYPPLGKTFAQMTTQEKNHVSHRGRAMAELRGEAEKIIKWLDLRMAEEPS
ncbi:MAG: XTP/dITP diphosphatase [Desulfobacteraceae bacterium]|nr:MAG: XTP/dITP diphosphatase [Desulfobacteraceae bacterium]